MQIYGSTHCYLIKFFVNLHFGLSSEISQYLCIRFTQPLENKGEYELRGFTPVEFCESIFEIQKLASNHPLK